MTSYFINSKDKRAFELNRLSKRSILYGYARVWLGVFCAANLAALAAVEDKPAAIAVAMLPAILLASLIGLTYWVDSKQFKPQQRLLREMMGRHLGVALDPFDCLENFSPEITSVAQRYSSTTLEEYWYKPVLRDSFASQPLRELAMLRARCDQHDKVLQQEVFMALEKPAPHSAQSASFNGTKA
ncbi:MULTISPECIES: hypothetical protein [unclassified Duganella]|uniref:hypothetical protein n=1 Tax=unclassified Duganella TaxID=2636909 RepID=UPI0006FAD30F|nr:MULTISPECIES: hypothetical protein [unclassified Duganella]KQV44715.1 hypothetical protein ASD07_19350 [Duganella sp. Root336D2]KRB83237.1 hypothetical protein ASE26_12190 [Duganella sp. Root198D2]